MEAQTGFFQTLSRSLARNRAGLGCFFCISAVGCCTGYALFTRLFQQTVLRYLGTLSQMDFIMARPLPMLLGALLPPVLLGTGMLLCSFSLWALPLWGLLVFLESCRWGMACGLLGALCQAGVPGMGHATVLPGLLTAVLAAGVLCLQPLERLRRPRDPFGFDDVAGDVLSTLIPTMAAAAAGTLWASLSGVLCIRALLP